MLHNAHNGLYTPRGAEKDYSSDIGPATRGSNVLGHYVKCATCIWEWIYFVVRSTHSSFNFIIRKEVILMHAYTKLFLSILAVRIRITWSTNRSLHDATCPVVPGLWFLRIFYKSPFASKFSWKKKSSHQGKKEVACIVSSFLFVGMWRVCKSSNNFTSRRFRGLWPKGDPGLLPIFQDLLLLSNHTPVINFAWGLSNDVATVAMVAMKNILFYPKAFFFSSV